MTPGRSPAHGSYAIGYRDKAIYFLLLWPSSYSSKLENRYLSSQTSSMRQPLVMLLTMIVSPFTCGCQQLPPRL